MPFSASTSRTRWLCGSVGLEKRVITERRLVMTAMLLSPGRNDRCRPGAVARLPGRPSMNVLPELAFQEIREQEEHKQEPQHADAQRLPFKFHRLADILQE